MSTERLQWEGDAEGAGRARGGSDATPCAKHVRLLGVDYAHLETGDGGDLYVTPHGLPFLDNLLPENWYAKPWFESHRERLRGTSTVYKVLTRPVGGRQISLVVKWSRVGQDVPLETKILNDVLGAEFNSPFEEFALLEEMRRGVYGPQSNRMLTHRPLCIYVPPERLQLWQTGRSRYKINLKLHRHPAVEIDILRQYILVYEWIRGIDAVDAGERSRIRQEEVGALTHRAIGELEQKGFQVADMKPVHIIVRERADGSIVRRKGKIAYALVDFELLQRTPVHEEAIQAQKRTEYLARQRDRFGATDRAELPSFLELVTIFGVDYVCGHVASTGGALWVVGHDPHLFDYFQPERWRTERTRLSDEHEVYRTRTKDNVHLIWKVSRVGERPDVDAERKEGRRILDYGYNSPFEEFAFAFALSRCGIPTTYPRAIYRAGPHSERAEVADPSRYDSHRGLLGPDGHALLCPDHDYVKIWGFWNGPDDLLARDDSQQYRSLNALEACRSGLLTEAGLQNLVAREEKALAQAGYEALNLSGRHLLLSLSSSGALIADSGGAPDVRLCNFELVRRL